MTYYMSSETLNPTHSHSLTDFELSSYLEQIVSAIVISGFVIIKLLTSGQRNTNTRFD